MAAVYKHELKTYYKTILGYVFAFIMLIFIGIYAAALMKNGAVQVEYILGNMGLVLCVLVPLLTMRTVAEERKMKTDQLLYSLPLSTTDIILGKFFALLTVFAVPLVIVCIYPLIFNFYGNINLLKAYVSIISFLFFGASCLSIGIFISSLFENQIIAGGVCLVIFLVNYFLSSIAGLIGEEAYLSLFIFIGMALLLMVIIWLVTKNQIITGGFGVLACGGLFIAYFIDPTKFEGLATTFLEKLSLFDHYYNFMFETFGLMDILFFISVSVLFLFLSVQSLERRRWN